MSNANEPNPDNAQHEPAGLAQQALGGNSSAPMVPKVPLIDLHSNKADRRVNPQRCAS